MSPIVKNLLGKEFRELMSPAIAAMAITVSIPLCYVLRDPGDAFFAVLTAFWVYPLLAGVFFGMRAAAGERASRVGSFVAALPASYRVLGTVRLAAISLAAVLPLLTLLPLGIGLSLINIKEFAGIRDFEGGPLWTAMLCASSALATICWLSIVAAAGTGQPTEIRAGAVGIASGLGLWTGWTFLFGCVGIAFQLFRPQYVEYPAPTWTIYAVLEALAFVAFVVGPVICLAILPPLIFIARYARTLGPFDATDRRAMPKWSDIRSHLPAWSGIRSYVIAWNPKLLRNSTWTALVWKDTREIGFVGLIVFLASLLLSTLGALVGITGNGHLPISALVTEVLPPVLWVGGFVLSILIGVGAAIGDVQTGVNTFWRSRPIPPGTWYWIKYIVGLATILVAVELPYLLCVGSKDLPAEEYRAALFWMLIWNATFSLSLTATCLVRQPLQAAILATGAAGLLFAAVQAIFGSGPTGADPLALPAFVIAFMTALVVSTFAGAWVAKHDVAIS